MARNAAIASLLLWTAAADTAVSQAACAASNWQCSLQLSTAMSTWCGQVVGSSANCNPACAVGASSMATCTACVVNMYAMSSYCTWVGSTGSQATTQKAPATTTTLHVTTLPPPATTLLPSTTTKAPTLPTTTTHPPTTLPPVSTTVPVTTALRGATTTTTGSTKAVTTVPSAATTTPVSGTVALPSPRRIVYIDYRDIDWSNPGNTLKSAVDAGYNVINLAFLLSNTPADLAQVWFTAGAASQLAALNYAHSKGAVLMVSAGGSTDNPWTAFADGTSYGTYAGQWAQQHNLDGVDFDIENFGSGFVAGSLSGDQLATFLADASIAAKKYVKFVSHAPQAPYFGPIGASGSTFWPGTSGGYSGVEAKSAGAVDFYNVQFYNQGATCYTTYAGLFTSSASDCAVFPGTSVQEIASYGVPLHKITVTKYLGTGDASNGYVSAAGLNGYFRQAATAMGYKSGVSCWAWATAESPTWIAATCSGGVC